MRKFVFKVEFLSEVVLNASSNSEGNIKQLDFIPGSAFLGMVAKEYTSFEDPFRIFHSGAVRFGDAHVLIDGKESFKMPLSYFHEKLDDSQLYNHHFIEDFSQFTQLKQLRNGYITNEKNVTNLTYNYTQKSAYDKELRRSKDSSMFGYNALPKGLQWSFVVTCKDKIDENTIQKIKNVLLDSNQLGKSKSAQYGRVRITFEQELPQAQNLQNNDTIIVYAKSRLALVDENGHPTYNPLYLCDGLSQKNIVMEKSQIKISSFTPYNNQRRRFDYERFCIEKGSVIVLQNLTQEQIKQLHSGIGAYLSEGFGEILINPDIVMDKQPFNLKKEQQNNTTINQRKKITQTFQDQTLQFLANRHNQTINRLDLAEEVANFIHNNGTLYNKKMNAQWGAIRAIATTNDNESIYNAIKKYISHGVAKEKWDANKKKVLLDAIEASKDKVAFTKLLAMQMPKIKGE